MFLLYNFLVIVASPIWLPWMLWRAKKRKDQPNWKERTGDYEIPKLGQRPRIWLHAVSVGEVIAALPILRCLRERSPEHELLLSVTTSSGHKTAQEKTVGLVDHLHYFPIDVTRFQLAAMTRVRPSAVAVMETELWMNFLWAAKAIGAGTLLINGRISDRSFPRSRRLRFFYRSLLRYLDKALMQTETDAARIAELGAASIEVLGNTKFDEALEGLDADPQKWRELLGIPNEGFVVVVGSTRGDDEEELVLDAISQVGIERLYVVHAPRHLESAERLRDAAMHRFLTAGLKSNGDKSRYLILDTYGELAQVYSAADLVVVGGGFSNLGGQNLIQPLAHGKPVLHGPHMQNFRAVADAALKSGASLVCDSSNSLAAAIEDLMAHPEKRERMARAANELVRENEGASERYAEAILQVARANEIRRR